MLSGMCSASVLVQAPFADGTSKIRGCCCKLRASVLRRFPLVVQVSSCAISGKLRKALRSDALHTPVRINAFAGLTQHIYTLRVRMLPGFRHARGRNQRRKRLLRRRGRPLDAASRRGGIYVIDSLTCDYIHFHMHHIFRFNLFPKCWFTLKNNRFACPT